MWLTFFSILLLLLSEQTTARYHLKENSLYSPYLSSDWVPYGSTIINSQFVSLTTDTKSNKGGIYNTKPIISRDWEISILFHVHGQGTTLYGDGFAFWYTQAPPLTGPAFGSRDIFRGLAIFFDTYANQNGEHSHEHPYINAMVNNGSKRYDHDKDGTLTESAGCSSNFRNKKYSEAIIRYSLEQLSVSFKYEGVENPVECFKINGVKLPTGYYIGVSAATGDLSDNHDIHAIHTYELYVSHKDSNPLRDYSDIEPSVDHDVSMRDRIPDDPMPSRRSSIFWLVFYWSIIISIIGGSGYFGYKYYLKRQRQYKRFY